MYGVDCDNNFTFVSPEHILQTKGKGSAGGPKEDEILKFLRRPLDVLINIRWMEEIRVFTELVSRELHSVEESQKGNGRKEANHRLVVTI